MGILAKLFGDQSKITVQKTVGTQGNNKQITATLTPKNKPETKQVVQQPTTNADREAQLIEIAQISDMDVLKGLVKQYKGKQKKLYRAAKDRLELMKTRQYHIDELQVQFDGLGQAAVAQTLSTSAVLSAEKQLNALADEIPTEVVQRHNQSLITLKEVAKAIESAKNARQSILSVLTKAHDDLKNGEFADNRKVFNALMNEQQQAWLNAPKWQSAEAKGMDIRFEQLLSQANTAASQHFDEKKHKNAQGKILSQCQRWLKNNTFVTADMLADQEKRWQSLSPLAEPAEQKNVQREFETLIAQLRDKSNQQITAQSDNDSIVPKLLEEFAKALEEGQVKNAQHLQTQIRDRLNSDAGLSKPVYQAVSGRFKRLENRLTELKKWQHFGNDHVRQDLIDAMQKLADDTTMYILDKADQVKALQEQWKALKGHAPNTLWEQFKATADKAWEPCAAHFKAERSASKDLLKQRMDFLNEAQKHLDAINWEQPNWKALGEAHKKFEQMWRSFPKLQEKEYRKAKKAHDDIVKQWDKHLDAERKREKARREELIKQAEAQLGAEDTQAATNVIKDLQNQWSPTLSLKKRSAEQALWERFKTACDAVFAAHHQQLDESRQAINFAFESHQAHLDDIASLFDNEADYDTLKTTFHEAMQALPDFDDVPEKAQRALRAQVKHLMARFDNHQNESAMRKRMDYLAQLRVQDTLCSELESGLNDAERLETLTNEWQALEPLLSDGQNAMRKRYEQAIRAQQQGELPHQDGETIIEAQDICLSLELTANLPSPAFAKDAREAMRLKILDDAMNGDKSFEQYKTEAGLYELIVRWRTLSKAALNETNSGDTLTNWCSRFDESVQLVRQNHQLKAENVDS